MVRTQLACTPTGWDALDCELPGNGWPSQCLTEILQPQAGQLEWRLAATALQQQSLQRQAIVALGAPLPPHASGLAQQGIAPEQLPDLFTRYQRGGAAKDGGDESRGAGIGLGLLIVKTVAERHGGAVAVRSQPGAGSCFSMRLPAYHGPAYRGPG